MRRTGRPVSFACLVAACVAACGGPAEDPRDASDDMSIDAPFPVAATAGSATTSSGANSQLLLTVGGSIAAGHRLVVAVTATSAQGSVTCVDAGGNTYALDSSNGGGGSPITTVFSSTLTTALSSGDAVTLDYPVFSGPSVAVAIDLSGVSAQPPDQTVTGAANNATPNTPPSGQTAAPTEAVVAIIGWIGTATLSANSPFAWAGTVIGGTGALQHNLAVGTAIVSMVDEYSVAATLSATSQWTAQLVTYR